MLVRLACNLGSRFKVWYATTHLLYPSTFSKNKICAWSFQRCFADVLRKELAHTSSFSCATVKKLCVCVCSLSLCVSLNVRRFNLDGLKNPSQLQPFLITYSCSASAGFYSLQVTRLPQKRHNATRHLSQAFHVVTIKAFFWLLLCRQVCLAFSGIMNCFLAFFGRHWKSWQETWLPGQIWTANQVARPLGRHDLATDWSIQEMNRQLFW